MNKQDSSVLEKLKNLYISVLEKLKNSNCRVLECFQISVERNSKNIILENPILVVKLQNGAFHYHIDVKR